MKKYYVKVIKMQQVVGRVEVEAKGHKDALKQVKARMSDTRNPMQTTEPEWDDPVYVDFSFETTGEVEEA